MKAWDFPNLIVEFAQDCANRARGYAESAEAAESDKYRARYASDSKTKIEVLIFVGVLLS